LLDAATSASGELDFFPRRWIREMMDDYGANLEWHRERKCIHYYFTQEKEGCLPSLYEYNKPSITGVTYDQTFTHF